MMPSTLAEIVNRHTHDKEDGFYPTAIKGLHFIKMSEASAPSGVVYKRSLCITVQGAKEVTFGDSVFEYNDMSYVLVTIQIPAFSKVTDAKPDRPYLGIVIDLDDAALRGVLDELSEPPVPSKSTGIGVFASKLGPDLEGCILRLLKLLDNKQAISILQSTIMREICFWLLTGSNAGEICKLILPNSHLQRVAEAISFLRENFDRAIRIEDLASAAQMSSSAFHQHFRTLTAMTPLQYQKQLRLMEGRRLMISENLSVSRAAFQVGYESSSQFSREYLRMFRVTPKRDSQFNRKKAE